MKTAAWSLALGISTFLTLAGCSDDDATPGRTGNTGGQASNTGGQQSATGGNTATGGSGGGNQATGGSDATGGSGGGNQATGSAPEPTAAAIAAFIAAGTYKAAPWISDSAGPRAEVTAGGPHGRVQVWFNDTIQTSLAAGNGVFDTAKAMGDPPHTTGSMIVKELFDENDARIGAAVMLKVAGDGRTWVFYGEGPGEKVGKSEDSTVYTAEAPFYANAPAAFDANATCVFCHTGAVLAPGP